MKNLIYVTRDLERALGLPLDTPGYFVVTNASPFARRMAHGQKNILLVEAEQILDTIELLKKLENLNDWLESKSDFEILVFKNTPQIETLCQKNNWPLINPSAELGNKIEEKISQFAWLTSAGLTDYLPNQSIQTLKNLNWTGENFILQFNRAHTGSGTILISNKDQLDKLQLDFPEREARVSEFIIGPAFTSNNIVDREKTLVGNLNYQITGLLPFTNQPFATIGNDWSTTKKILSADAIEAYQKIVQKIGDVLGQIGWRGIFGTDMIWNQTKKRWYLIEINARQTAGTAYESILMYEIRKLRNNTKKSLTIFEAHISALRGENLADAELIKISDGAQVVLRIQDDRQTTKNKEQLLIEKLEKDNLTVIPYENTKPGADYLRIQSLNGLLNNHNEWNEIGKKICSILTPAN